MIYWSIILTMAKINGKTTTLSGIVIHPQNKKITTKSQLYIMLMYHFWKINNIIEISSTKVVFYSDQGESDFGTAA